MKKNLVLLTLIAIITACGNDPKSEVDNNQLFGKWEVNTATRDGKETSTLDQLYFTFSEDGNMETNMPTLDRASTYELSGSEIQQNGNGVENNYTIESLSDSELILITTIRNTEFRMILNKADG
ncbi:MAG: lipocalin family protein [Bacteroidota bacterium]